MEMKLYLMHMSWSGLQNLEMHEDLEDDKGMDNHQLLKIQTFAKVHKLWARDCWTPLKLMQDQLHIKEETSHTLHKDFRKKKIHLKFVPHSLM